jgi:hypothetical protein
MMRPNLFLAATALSLCFLSGCGGSGSSLSPLDPSSYIVATISGSKFIATAASGAFVYVDPSENAVLIKNDGSSTQLATLDSSFYSAHISPNGDHVLITNQSQTAPFELTSKYYRNGVQEQLPTIPPGSTAPIMVDNSGYLYGSKPGQTYRTNGITTEYCDTPNSGFFTIILTPFATGEDPKYLQEFNFAAGNIPTYRWFEFKDGSTPELVHDLNGQGVVSFHVTGLTRNGTAFGRVVNSPSLTTFSKPINSSIELGNQANPIKVFGKLDSGAIFAQYGNDFFVEYKLNRVNLEEITGLDPDPNNSGSVAKGNSLFTYGIENSVTKLVIVRSR